MLVVPILQPKSASSFEDSLWLVYVRTTVVVYGIDVVITSVNETVVGIYDVDQTVVEDTTVTGKLVVKVETETCREKWVSIAKL